MYMGFLIITSWVISFHLFQLWLKQCYQKTESRMAKTKKCFVYFPHNPFKIRHRFFGMKKVHCPKKFLNPLKKSSRIECIFFPAKVVPTSLLFKKKFLMTLFSSSVNLKVTVASCLYYKTFRGCNFVFFLKFGPFPASFFI